MLNSPPVQWRLEELVLHIHIPHPSEKGLFKERSGLARHPHTGGRVASLGYQWVFRAWSPGFPLREGEPAGMGQSPSPSNAFQGHLKKVVWLLSVRGSWASGEVLAGGRPLLLRREEGAAS